MALTNAFKEAISTGNIRRIRIMMKNSILYDPTFSEYNTMKNATQDLLGLYDIHDGQVLNYDKNTWDDSYMNELMFEIVSNFSHKRIEHLQEVVKYLHPMMPKSHERDFNNRRITETINKQTYTQQSTQRKEKCHSQENNFNRGTKIIVGTVIGAMAGGTIATMASASVIGGVVIGAVTGTVAVTVMTKGE